MPGQANLTTPVGTSNGSANDVTVSVDGAGVLSAGGEVAVLVMVTVFVTLTGAPQFPKLRLLSKHEL